MIRPTLFALLALIASPYADDWGTMATISSTLGVNANRVCLGEASRGDIGCPAYTPYVASNGYVGFGTSAPVTQLHVSGTLSLEGTPYGGLRMYDGPPSAATYLNLIRNSPDAGANKQFEIVTFNRTTGAEANRTIYAYNGAWNFPTYVTAGSSSQVILQPGTSSNNGYVSVYGPSGARSGYFGWNSQGSVNVLAETGTVHIIANGNITYFQPNGNVVVPAGAFKPGGGSWSDSSDQRLKTNIRPIKGALEKLTALQGVTFDWKEPSQHTTDTAAGGFVAQDVAKVFPEFVAQEDCKGEECTLVANGKISTLGLPLKFDAYVVEAIKELKAENEALRQELKLLKQKVDARD